MLNKLRKKIEEPHPSRPVSEQGQPGHETPRVVVYSTTWCPSCRVAKRYLAQRGVPYVEIDIERVEGAAEQLMRWARGYKTVPTIKIDDTNRRGLGPKSSRASLNRSGTCRPSGITSD